MMAFRMADSPAGRASHPGDDSAVVVAIIPDRTPSPQANGMPCSWRSVRSARCAEGSGAIRDSLFPTCVPTVFCRMVASDLPTVLAKHSSGGRVILRWEWGSCGDASLIPIRLLKHHRLSLER